MLACMNEFSLSNPVPIFKKKNCCGIPNGGGKLPFYRERAVYYQRIINQQSLTEEQYSHNMEMWHTPTSDPLSESMYHYPPTSNFPSFIGDQYSPSISCSHQEIFQTNPKMQSWGNALWGISNFDREGLTGDRD
ncbi:hypothetical protein, unlikely [Trypanosoma congolense IL3000]|uniref:Uncharacterized protein n=1 Tax=Trypanosoma congolense (strain IL3000) TaxID=1068625 RepID=F9WBC3_TRYCI|nr:hypothetical protein, unlikely [Trypanosoma congolense IL3000]